ncbi:hypothetical protein, partial [Burkholderia sp. BCC1993]|uniref:hypothetical protein n=1 Tax=Burkholderia sp. BCC1993 TaxID=2817444 RepID=UPI002AB120BD
SYGSFHTEKVRRKLAYIMALFTGGRSAADIPMDVPHRVVTMPSGRHGHAAAQRHGHHRYIAAP